MWNISLCIYVQTSVYNPRHEVNCDPTRAVYDEVYETLYITLCIP